MIYNVVGQEFIYEGVTYRVGAEVVGTAESDYRGLNGFILEIRTGDDRETENETPDIHCYFDPPCLPSDIEELEKRFTALYGTEKKLEDITLDYVIMAPEEILVLQSPRKTIEIYVLEEDWAANDEYGYSTEVFADYYEAKAKLNAKLEEEMKNGCLTDWMDDDEYQFDTDADSYEGWLDGWHATSHYSLSITKLTLNLPNSISGFSQLRTERPKQKNHPLCGCASVVIPKNSPRWYNKVVQVLEYNERRILWQIAQTV